MKGTSRRTFLQRAGFAALVGTMPGGRALSRTSASSASKRVPRYSLGMASYTFRAYTLEQTIAMTKRLGLKTLTLKDMHLPMQSTEQEIKGVLEKIRAAGLTLAACGVIYMKNEDEVRHAFRYARMAELKMIIGVPDAPLLGLTEKLAKEYDIAVAIHNHGPADQRYPSPESAYVLIEKMDKHMGLCIDAGHTQRLGLDPAAQIEKYFDRVLDIHIKDVSSADVDGSTVEIGRGVINIPALLATLQKLGYDRTVHFEHEKDEKDSFPGVAESVGFVRGVLATID
jgi:inosose dehydratase